MNSTTPAEAEKEHEKSGAVQEYTTEIHFLELLRDCPVAMQMGEIWWEVEQDPQDGRSSIQACSKIVDCLVPCRGIDDEQSCNIRAES